MITFTKDDKNFKAKILLFGEYTVICGSSAIAIPFDKYSGKWTMDSKDQVGSVGLRKLFDYLSQLENRNAWIDLDAFQHDISEGLCFKSNIPEGYGLGSSGALTSGFYHRYVEENETNINTLRDELIQIENGFHGSSSGIDPLVSYLDQAILVDEVGELSILEDFELSQSFFLIDTGIKRETAPLVAFFKEKYLNDLNYKEGVHALRDVNNRTIKHFLNKDWENVFEGISEISQAQLSLFNGMIPVKFKLMWKEGISSDYFRLKLCGAGAGGMILGMTNDRDRLLANYRHLDISFI